MSTTIAPKEAPIPSAYIIVARTQTCDCCKATHTWSETYALSTTKARLGLGTPSQQLHKIREPRYRVPIWKRHTNAERIPFCHACYEPSLANTANLLELPTPSDDYHRVVAVSTTPLEKPVQAASAPPKRPPAATPAEIDALIS